MEPPLLYQKTCLSLLKTCKEEECDVHLATGQRGTFTQTVRFGPDNIKVDMFGDISLQFCSVQWGCRGEEVMTVCLWLHLSFLKKAQV